VELRSGGAIAGRLAESGFFTLAEGTCSENDPLQACSELLPASVAKMRWVSLSTHRLCMVGEDARRSGQMLHKEYTTNTMQATAVDNDPGFTIMLRSKCYV
jgi:hypothetical protein